MPEGSTVEATNRVLGDLAQVLDRVPEVDNYQAYAGTAAPITFNGLVRQYYLRSGPLAGDLQVNLVDKSERRRKSHDIARAVRPELAAVGKRYGAAVKVVEVPPGPPVLSPIVAEIYGPDESGVRALALKLEKAFGNNPDIVDLDSSVEAPSTREVMVVDRARAARLGLNQADIARTLAMAHAGADPTYAMDGQSRYAVPIRVRLPAGDQASLDQLLALKVRARNGRLVPLSEVVEVREAAWERAVYRKDMRPTPMWWPTTPGAPTARCTACSAWSPSWRAAA